MKKVFLGLAWIFSLQVAGQGKYLVYFKDKSDNPFSINKPEEFLSQKSIDRRLKQNITIKEYDLPVSPKYIDSLKKYDLTVWYTSRWFNAAYVESNKNLISLLQNKPFVKEVTLLKPNLKDNKTSEDVKFTKKLKIIRLKFDNTDYGNSLNQASQLCVDEMHRQGFKGEGMNVAIFDGGFTKANEVFFLDSLFAQDRVKDTYDFVLKNNYVYSYSSHGTNVLSCMAGYAKGSLIGTAYKANYFLYRTEDGDTEYPVEEANWLIAAERCDSIGVDLINSSLGYTSFDDTSMSYKYKQRNGKIPISSRAATFAARVGMLCVVSAGNSGRSSEDPYISAPGDADSVITVGAIDSDKRIASFSSIGFTVDGRVKPNLVAKGVNATVGNPNNTIGTSNGTSFSSPILCGMAAGLWQSLPNYTNMQIIDLLHKSADNYNNPNESYGYGLPCFVKAQLLSVGRDQAALNDAYIYPNPFFTDNLTLVVNENDLGKEMWVEVYDTNAKLIHKQKIAKVYANNPLDLKSKALLPGLYFVKVSTLDYSTVIKVVKNQ
jgi:hypothetical protein